MATMQGVWILQFALAAFIVSYAAGFTDQMAACGQGIQMEMNKCVKDSDIDLQKISSISSNPAQLQAMNKELKNLCTTNKLPGIVDCIYGVMKRECPGPIYDALSKYVNIDGIKEMITYMCNNIDELMDVGYKTCMDNSQNTLKPCIERKTKDIVEMVEKEKDAQKKITSQICYSYDLSRYCMKPAVTTCPSNGKHIMKILELIKPKQCKGYTLAAGITKPSSVLVIVAVFNVILAYIW